MLRGDPVGHGAQAVLHADELSDERYFLLERESRYHNYLAPDAGRSAVLQYMYMYMYRTEPVPPFILTFQMRSISHVVACQVELALFHRALGVVFQEH